MLKFRNLDVTPDDPVELWGVEGILTAIERGGLVDIRRVARAARRDPFGEVAADLEQAVELTDSPIAARLKILLAEWRGGERALVARRIRDAIAISGLSLRAFAEQLGTSASRLSSYANGKVQPSAALYLRILKAGHPGGLREGRISVRDAEASV